MKNFRQYRYQFKRSCASGPVLGCTRLHRMARANTAPNVFSGAAQAARCRELHGSTGWHAPIPLRIQAELRKRPGVGMYTAHRMACANTATNSSGAAQAARCWDSHGSPDGTRQYRYEFKRSCASGPVLGCTRLTGSHAPIPLPMPKP